ncbi:MAG: CarD family transcriptional regulator, partial [Corynebacterium sp.]|nr:CarD family transcriptional regulator [Corynebacterium sp.]
RGLSAGEKRMLAKARQILVGELALADTVDEKKADEFLVKVEAHVEADAPEPEILDDGDLDVDLDDLTFDDED